MEAIARARRASSKGSADAREVEETALRLGALFRYLFSHDGGAQLRAMEDSGLSFTQCKALFLLAVPDRVGEQPTLNELADGLGTSLASVSRAIDGMVRRRLVTRVEDRHDRRLRRIAITAKGERVVGDIVEARISGLVDFSAALTSTQRRKLDAALESLLERKEIAETYERLSEARSR